ncbi:MAG: RNA 2',3'-cyclic phosphodiesterase [Candidatus Dormibacteraceae bacterium]
MGAKPGREAIRAFVGVELPAGHVRELAGHLERCRATEPRLRWVPPANLHVTLRFLGNVEGDVLDVVRAALPGIEGAPFEMALGAPGCFGRRDRARVVWLRVEAGEPELARLAAAVDAVCAGAGLARDDRAYHPHLTLARAPGREGVRLPDLPEPPRLDAWTVPGLTLFRSRLRRGSAAYERLARFPFAR